MIIDGSAIIAILFSEPDALDYATALAEAPRRKISAATFVEGAIVVVTQTKDAGPRPFDAFMRRAAIEIELVTEEQAHVARQADTDFGKGRHPAALNFGHCFAYALSKITGDPLLFKGDDFSKTDIVSALSP